MIKAIIFDFDNTLADRELALKNFSRHLVTNFLDYGLDDIESIIEFIVNEDRNGDRSKPELYDCIASKYDFHENLNVNNFINYWRDNFYKYTTLKKNALTILKQFKSLGYKLAIITNGNTVTQNAKIDYTGIRQYFSYVIVSQTVGIRKPHRDIYNLALEKLDVSPDEAIMVGDQPVCDIVGARQVGITPVWIHKNKTWNIEEKEPDYIITELSELKEVLKSII